MEHVLGLVRQGEELVVTPCIPPSWTQLEVTYRYGGSELLIQLENPSGVQTGVRRIELDGASLPSNRIPLADDGRRHRVRVTLGEAGSALSRPRGALPESHASGAGR